MSVTDIPQVSLSAPDHFFIGGEWVKPTSSDQIDVINSSTEEVFFRVAEAKAEDMDRARWLASNVVNTLEGARILVLGAGGAARAAVFGLKERGCEVYILNRSLAPAKKLAHQARARIVKRPDLKKLAFDVIINATPVGMGNTKETPLQDKEINARYVFDMVYDPAETRFLKLARERGAQIIPGIEMFVHQAARQFEIWTGKPAPWDEMLKVVLLALQERATRSAAGK